jgi:hypothetical protein
MCVPIALGLSLRGAPFLRGILYKKKNIKRRDILLGWGEVWERERAQLAHIYTYTKICE